MKQITIPHEQFVALFNAFIKNGLTDMIVDEAREPNPRLLISSLTIISDADKIDPLLLEAQYRIDETDDTDPKVAMHPDVLLQREMRETIGKLNSLLAQAAGRNIDVELETRETGMIDAPVMRVHVFATLKQLFCTI